MVFSCFWLWRHYSRRYAVSLRKASEDETSVAFEFDEGRRTGKDWLRGKPLGNDTNRFGHVPSMVTRTFFPQPIVEGLLNSRRRVSDRPSWILTSKTPARKSMFFFFAQAFRAELKAEPDIRYTNIFKLRRNPILGTPIF